LLTSGLAQKNPLLMQLMANVLGREILAPQIDHATAVGTDPPARAQNATLQERGLSPEVPSRRRLQHFLTSNVISRQLNLIARDGPRR
jgi:sugar (pentulose or hexulose) kinase